MELLLENLTLGLNRYLAEVTAIHTDTPSSSFHVTRANAMKQLLFDFELLTDASNHELVETAKKTAEKERSKKNRRQVK